LIKEALLHHGTATTLRLMRPNCEIEQEGFSESDEVTTASIVGHKELFQRLVRIPFLEISSNCYFGPPLVSAARNNHYNIAKFLLDRRFVATPAPEYVETAHGSALMVAAKAGNDDIVELLLEP
jgi:ankyrin repeat protein